MGRILNLAMALGILGLAGCGGGQSSSGGNMGGIAVTVTPSSTSVVVGQQVPFMATVTGTANTAVTWEVAGIFQTNANQSAQNLPIILGTSGGNADDKVTQGGRTTCCSGTLGSLVVRNGINYILSNNHVLARSDHRPAVQLFSA